MIEDRGERQRGASMRRSFTLEYWMDDDWYVGKLKEIPNVFSQGESLTELEENIRDAYQLLLEAEPESEHADCRSKEIEVEV
jgi:predicted RNase H-like HicB family nuclease